MRNSRLILLVLVLILINTVALSYQVLAEDNGSELPGQIPGNNNTDNTQETQPPQTSTSESQGVEEATASAYITPDLKHIVVVKGKNLYIYEVSNGVIGAEPQKILLDQVEKPISISVSNDLSKILVIDQNKKGFYYYNNSLKKVFDNIVTGLISPSGKYLVITIVDKEHNGVATSIYDATSPKLEKIKDIKALTTANIKDIKNVPYYWFTNDEKLFIAVIIGTTTNTINVYTVSFKDNKLTFGRGAKYTVGNAFSTNNILVYYASNDKSKVEYIITNHAYQKITINNTIKNNNTTKVSDKALLAITSGNGELLLSQLDRDVMGVAVVEKDSWTPKSFYKINITSLLAVIDRAKKDLDIINTLSDPNINNILRKIGVTNIQDIVVDAKTAQTIREIAKNEFTASDLELLYNVCTNTDKYEKILEDIENRRDIAITAAKSAVDSLVKQYDSLIKVLNNVKDLKETLAKIGVDIKKLVDYINQLNSILNTLKQQKITSLQDLYNIINIINSLDNTRNNIEEELNSLNIKTKLMGYLDSISKELDNYKKILETLSFRIGYVDFSKYENELKKLQDEVSSLPDKYSLAYLSEDDIERLEEVLNKTFKLENDIQAVQNQILQQVQVSKNNIEKEYSSLLSILNDIKKLKEPLNKVGIDITPLEKQIDELNTLLEKLKQQKVTSLQDIRYINDHVKKLNTTRSNIEKELNNLNIKAKLEEYLKNINGKLSEPIKAIIPFLPSSIDASKYEETLSKLEADIKGLPRTYSLTSLSNTSISRLEDILNRTISLENDITAERSSVFMFLLVRDVFIILVAGFAVFVSYKWFRRWQADKPRRDKLKEVKRLLDEIIDRIEALRRTAKRYPILENMIEKRVKGFRQKLYQIKTRIRIADTLEKAKILYNDALELLSSVKDFDRSLRELVSMCDFISAKDLSRDTYALSDKGYRENNEDFSLVEKIGDCALLLVVADGMGGHRAGEVASKEAVEKLFSHIREEVQLNPLILVENPKGLVQRAIKAANRHVYELSLQKPEYRGMGTTLTLALVLGEKRVVIGHVGDSRAYLIRRKKILQLTKDHTLVQQLVDEGKITREEAKIHPERHVLIKAVGVEPDVEPDVFFVEEKVPGGIRRGDVLLLCSDGLTDVVDDNEIHRLVVNLGDLKKAAEVLRDKALPSNDNITIVLYRH